MGTAVGDGVAVPGPKGERGEPGPAGDGKPGKNVRELCIYLFMYNIHITMHVFILVLLAL